MINSDSRYANCSIEPLSYGNQTRVSITGLKQVTGVFGFTYYQIVDNDTVDDISYRVLGDGQLWWKIADINPEILMWDQLTPGQIIRIPNGA